MARNPIVQNLLDQFVVSNGITGARRVVLVNFRTLANALARDIQDSTELVDCLNLLITARDKALIAALSPNRIPNSAEARARGIEGSAGRTRVTVGETGV